jgi:SET domain-containing protein
MTTGSRRSRTGDASAKRRRLPYAIRRSEIAGRGAFAVRRIRPGQRIVEYTGERITEKEADKRYPDDDKRKPHHTFLFALDDHMVIDATYGGNSSRYINHSCDPNCEAIEEDGRIFIHAVKNIQPGVELAYDYSYARQPGDGPKEEAIYPCFCGSPKCRGTIMEAPKRRRKRRKKARRPHQTS